MFRNISGLLGNIGESLHHGGADEHAGEQRQGLPLDIACAEDPETPALPRVDVELIPVTGPSDTLPDGSDPDKSNGDGDKFDSEVEVSVILNIRTE